VLASDKGSSRGETRGEEPASAAPSLKAKDTVYRAKVQLSFREHDLMLRKAKIC